MRNIIAVTKKIAFIFDTDDQASVEHFMILLGYSTRSYYLDFEEYCPAMARVYVSVKVIDSERSFTVTGHNPNGPYEVQPEDVGKRFLSIHGVTHMLSNSIGYIQEIDVGKLIYVKDYGLAIENDEQRDRRLKREEK